MSGAILRACGRPANDGEVGAQSFSLVASAKAAGIDPEAYLEDVIGKVATTPASRVGELTPWAWRAASEAVEDVDASA